MLPFGCTPRTLHHQSTAGESLEEAELSAVDSSLYWNCSEGNIEETSTLL